MTKAPSTGGRLEGRIALITGASRGIGRAIALRYAAEGAHLVLLARTQGALEEVDDEIEKLGGEATLVPADLGDFEAIDRIGAALHDRFGKLDILVGNAGLLGTLTPVHQIDPKIWEQVMAINVTANYRLLRSFDPLLRASDAGRGIFLTSTVGQIPRAYWGLYATSKAALEMIVRCYADEITKTKVRVNLVNPGPTRTGMRAEAMPGEDPETLKTPDKLADLFVDLAEPSCTRNGEVINGDDYAGS
ncbi:MAG: SDR family NAD(P)-dependent oxidoreductase [Rhodospirillales bacterium]|nr:SDR family NAD(P)-dependent oxidoreductase [Rhodospirillales bacterium]